MSLSVVRMKSNVLSLFNYFVMELEKIRKAILEEGTPATPAYVHHVWRRLDRLIKHLDLDIKVLTHPKLIDWRFIFVVALFNSCLAF